MVTNEEILDRRIQTMNTWCDYEDSEFFEDLNAAREDERGRLRKKAGSLAYQKEGGMIVRKDINHQELFTEGVE